MANRNNNFNFKIPGIIILLSFIFCWPVGVVLLILRSISSANSNTRREYRQEKRENTAQTYNYNYNYNYNYGNAKESIKKENAAPKTEEIKSSKRKASLLLKLFGGGALCSFLLSAFFFLGHIASGFVSNTPILLAGIFLALGGGLLLGASLTKKRDTRLQRIRAIVGNKKSINLVKLASASNSSIKKIRRDVQSLIDSGEFGDGAYIDLGTNNLMITSDAEPDDPEMFDYKSLYEDILKNEKKSEKSAQTEEKSENKADEEKKSDEEHFNSIIREIRRLNDEIEDKDVSDKIDVIEAHTKNIFDYVTENPEAMPQIRTFMNYYLPTTLKLLQSYSRIERVGVAGENMQKSKENIEKTLDLLVIGFEQQVDQLFKKEYIDISSDISVLEQMMQKDGLDGKNDFDISSYVEEAAPAESPVLRVPSSKTEEYSDDISDDLTGGAAAQSAPKE